MGANTGIEYVDATLNFWLGCEPVSEGCQRCFARRYWKRMGLKPSERRRVSDKTIKATLRKAKPGDFVFVNDLSDFFDPKVPEHWRQDALQRINMRLDLTFLLLTKRPALMAKWIDKTRAEIDYKFQEHIWLGVTAENQPRWDQRVGVLMEIDWPGKRFVSLEPLLGPVDADFSPSGVALGKCDECGHRGNNPACEACMGVAGIDWLIVGGESGTGARPMDPAWAREVRDECQAAGVPFFMKQMGGHPNRRGELADIPEDLRIRKRPTCNTASST